MAEAADRGMRTIILRAGDFFGGGRGSWLDLVIAKELRQGRVTYPGPLDVVHEWTYLPDLAAALVRLAAIRETLGRFETFGFPGHAVTGREFIAAIAKATGRRLQVKRMSWWLIHALRPFLALRRELSEIAYLWQEPHRIDGDKLKAAIGRRRTRRLTSRSRAPYATSAPALTPTKDARNRHDRRFPAPFHAARADAEGSRPPQAPHLRRARARRASSCIGCCSTSTSTSA